MTILTCEEMEKIGERCNKATPGPWRVSDDEPSDVVIWGAAEDELLVNMSDQHANTPANAEFIAHAREDIPWLIGEVKRLHQRDSDWHNLYMLMQRYMVSYKTMKAPSKKVFDGLKRFREKLGLDGILRDAEEHS